MYFRPESNKEQYIALAKDYKIPNSNVSFAQSLSAQCEKEDWVFFETNRGQKVVEFSGECLLDEQKPLNIQFLIDDDKKAQIGALLVDHKKIAEDEKAFYYEKLVMK